MNRYYICDNCNHNFVAQQSINSPLKKRCPQCKKNKLYQDLTGQHVFIYQEPTTIGQVAEKNDKKYGKELTQKKRDKNPKWKPKRKAPWYNSDNKYLPTSLSNLNTAKKRKDYILKGTVE